MTRHWYQSTSPTHSYTHYHECAGTVELVAPGQVLITSNCEHPGDARFNEVMSINEARSAFRRFDHNGAGARIRKILAQLATA